MTSGAAVKALVPDPSETLSVAESENYAKRTRSSGRVEGAVVDDGFRVAR